MSYYNNRVRALGKKRELELIRAWDYVDGVEHCIDLTDLKIYVCTPERMERNPNLESIEHLDGGLEYAYRNCKDNLDCDEVEN